MTDTCQYPTYEPTRASPAGACGRPATHAAPLGDTGRWLPMCPTHAQHRIDAVPLSEVPEG